MIEMLPRQRRWRAGKRGIGKPTMFNQRNSLSRQPRRPEAILRRRRRPTPADDPRSKRCRHWSADDSKGPRRRPQELVERGDDAVPQIKALAEKTDGPRDAGRRGGGAQAIEARSVNGPSLITLELKDVPVQEAIRQIAERPTPNWRSGPTGSSAGPVERPKGDPAGLAAALLAGDEGLAPGPWNWVGHMGGGRGRLTIQQGGGEMMKGPAHIEGPFMVVAANASESNTILYAKPDNRMSSVDIGMQVFVEPKVQLMGRGVEPGASRSSSTSAGTRCSTRTSSGGRGRSDPAHSRESSSRSACRSVKGRTKKVGGAQGLCARPGADRDERIEVPNVAKAKGSVVQERRLAAGSAGPGGDRRAVHAEEGDHARRPRAEARATADERVA